MMAKLSGKGSPLSGNNCTEEKAKEELVANIFDVYSSETYDDVMEAKRQKLKSEHGSDCNNEPLGTSDHAHAKEAVRCAFCHLSKITKVIQHIMHVYIRLSSIYSYFTKQNKPILTVNIFSFID